MTAAYVCDPNQTELQLPLVFLGVSPVSASGSDSGSFQIAASALGLGAYEILRVPLGVESLFSMSSNSYEILTGLSSQMF